MLVVESKLPIMFPLQLPDGDLSWLILETANLLSSLFLKLVFLVYPEF